MTEKMVSNSLSRYGLAVLGCLIALLLSRLMYPIIDGSAFDFFLAAVFLTALLGGLRPAILAAALSIIALDYFFITPLYSLTCGATDVLKLFIFGFVAVVTSGLSSRLKRIEIERA